MAPWRADAFRTTWRKRAASFAPALALIACGESSGVSADLSEETADAADVDVSSEEEASESSGDDSTDTGTTSEASSDETDTDTSSEETGPVPTCPGCLCAASDWSCTDDTLVTEDGHAVGLGPEAGFFELDGLAFAVDGTEYEQSGARLFYAFHPAENSPEDAPLALVFNGGPGSATGPLFAGNTAPLTLANGATPEENPDRWTDFANLLYVDARHTGFSYSLRFDDDSLPGPWIVPEQDAGDFIRVLLRFLARHPDLRGNPVVLVGESWGGVRSSIMLHLLLDPGVLLQAGSRYEDDALHDEIVAHYAATLGTETPTPEEAAAQFGHAALLQPLVLGQSQLNLPTGATPHCAPEPNDGFQCDQPYGWLFDRFTEILSPLMDPSVLGEMTDTDITTLAWMHADAREDAVKYVGDIALDESQLQEAFGALQPNDRYYTVVQLLSVPLTAPQARSERYGFDFLWDLQYVQVFITNALFDTIVWAPAIPPAMELSQWGEWVVSAEHVTAGRPGVDRPGWIDVVLGTSATVPGEREIRFPHYDASGHAVTLLQPQALHDDVEAWLEP